MRQERRGSLSDVNDQHRGSSWAIWVLLAFALVVRVGWALVQTTDEAAMRLSLPDQGEYLDLARSLLHGNGLRLYDDRFKDYVVAYRTPGYPVLLAALGGNVRAVRVAQALVDTSTVLAIYLLAMRLGVREQQALFAAALVALNPFLIYFSGLILTETLFTAMLAWGMVLLARPSRAAFVAGGVALALSILVRPSVIALPMLLGLVAVVMNRRQQTGWRLPPITTMAILTIVVLLPWALRNHAVLGRWVWTTTNSGITAYDGFNPDADGSSDQSFVKSMPQLRSMNEVDRSRYLSNLASDYVRDNPRRAVELAGRKIARTWIPVPLSQEFGRPLYRTIAILFALPFDLFVIIGLVRSNGLSRSAKVFLLLPAIYFTAVHALSVGSLRYRVPAEPPMAVLAATAVGFRGSSFRGFENSEG
jgi:4-amino-4-deoxy-L-arabinose transferase-like glycosyltransferase